MTRKAMQFPSGPLTLEGILYQPAGSEADTIVVVCHPHPQSGGSMHNNVVLAAAESLYSRNMSVLTFNFRGVGRSQGSYDGGAGEQDDATAAIGFAAGLDGVRKVGLAGYSFGAGIAAAVADQSIFALALVAPPTGRLQNPSNLTAYPGPVLLLAGARDHVASTETLDAVSKARTAPTDVVVVPGVDQFWRDAEETLKESVGSFFAQRQP